MLISLMFSACVNSPNKDSIEIWKQEIIEIEKQFCEMTANEGMAVSFTHFAADTATIKRGEMLIVGKKAISESYSNSPKDPNISLVWKPDFVDVSSSGDMAYTYGNYTYCFVDSTGVKQSSNGVFHTVWKRQSNGEWKYVFD